MTQSASKEDGTYAHIFAYCVPKARHKEMDKVEKALADIYEKHGAVGTKLYVLGKTSVFEGFAGIDKAFKATEDDEVWIEVDSYKDASDFNKVVEAVGADKDAGPLWGKLMELVTPGRSISMGEFTRL
jgi:uncharacterized protein YbaA (DUF1428 family)